MAAVRAPTAGITVAIWVAIAWLTNPVAVQAQVRFTDDFEADLSGWELTGAGHISVRESGFRDHGRVLVLEPGGSVFALVEDSDGWGPVRFDLDVLFPDNADNYLGLIYNYTETGAPEHRRTDFGSLYIKGNGSYIRANPWRDGNVSRLLYEEYKTRLTGADAVEIGEWQRVRVEVVGRTCHLYVGDLETPKVTFGLYENDSGKIGVNPRVAGWPVWIDNVEVTSIERLSYDGPAIPAIEYEPGRLLTRWEVAGPFPQPVPAIESAFARSAEPPAAPGGSQTWQSFETDPRGAVVTGRVTEYDGSRPVAYFRTSITSESDREAVLHFSTTDELTLWVNGRFHGFIYRNGYVFGDRDWNAWWDFHDNPDHEAAKEPIELRAGHNEIMVRVRNGQFASGGFFAALDKSSH